MSCLSLHLLGTPRVERDGVPIVVDTRKAIALLVYVAITGERHRRDTLVNLLWPEYDQTHGRAALRRTLSALRKALAGDWLDIDRESVGLNSGADIWLDVDCFHDHLARCRAHGHLASEVCPACLVPLTDAVALYRGDFLSGFGLKDSFTFDDWQFFQADTLRRELTGALERLVRCHCARAAFDSALDCARRWLALDCLSEAAHCQLMRVYAWCGRRSAALRQYQECVKILERQLGTSPQRSTVALYQAIVEGRAPEPPVGIVHRVEERSEGKVLLHSQSSMALPPGGEKRVATVVCADVGGSFRRAGRTSLEDEASLMDRFLEVMCAVLAKYGGQISRCLGRRVVGILGAAQSHEHDAEWAVRAALEIQREAGKLGLGVAAGINTGEIYVRRTDLPKGAEFALFGPVVDLAVRLSGRADVGRILVGASAYRLAHRAFEFTPLTLDIKGMEKPVPAYQVERLLPQPKKARGIEG